MIRKQKITKLGFLLSQIVEIVIKIVMMKNRITHLLGYEEGG